MANELPISYKSPAFLGCIVLLSFVATSCGDRDISAKLPMGSVDVPKTGQTISGHLNAIGWAVAEDRVTDVSVYVDRAFWKTCLIRGSRPDVNKVYPGFPEGDDSGWTVDLDASALPIGKHELEFLARSSKGAVREIGDISVFISH